MSKDNKHKHTDNRSADQAPAAEEELQVAMDEAGQDSAAAANVESQPADAETGQPEATADDTALDVESAAEEPVARPAPAPAVGSAGKGLSTLALLIALASAGASGWLWYQGQQVATPAPVTVTDHSAGLQAQEHKLQQLEQQSDSYQQQLEQLQQQLGQFGQRVDGLPKAAELADNQRLLVQMQKAQQAFTQRFEQAFGSTRQDWRLAEAEHLMRMAHLRLAALQDLNSARYLLEAADQILYEQDDPAAFAARQALAQALAEVRALPKLDREGVFMRLGALQKQVGKLDQILPGYAAGNSETGSVNWNRLLDKASSYIRLDINSNTDDIKPLLSSQQLIHIRLAVSLSLEQAQWAALNGLQEVYDQALAQGIELLTHYFSQEHQVAGSMRTQLQELADAKVSQGMPDINPALVALQGYIQERTLERRAPREAQP